MTDADVTWVATLSDGTTAVEHTGEYTIVPGARKPWVRLCTFLAENDLYLTSLRLNFQGRTVHMPRAKLDRFGTLDRVRVPLFYSLQYHVEAIMADGSGTEERTFIDLAAHFEDDIAVHYIVDVTDGNNSWVAVTTGDRPMAETPRRKDD